MRAYVTLAEPEAEALAVELASDRPASVPLPDGSTARVEPGRPYRYEVEVRRPSDVFLAVRAGDVLPAGLARVDLRAPEGWTSAHSPHVLTFGRDMRVARHALDDVSVRLATLGAPATESDLAYLRSALPYLRAQHDAAPQELLVVRAPDEALVDGFVAGTSVVLPQGASVSELAHLVARAHQRYRVVEVAPASAAWFREGEARLHAQMSLLAADASTSAEVDEEFTRARAVADPEGRLPLAPAGSTLARQKGLVVVRALDVELRNATNGTRGLADLVAALAAEGTRRLDSAALEQAAVALAGPALSPFFERYVYGSEWPATPGARDAADLFLLAFALREDEASQGDQVLAQYEIVNRGTQPSETELILRVSGVPTRTVPVRLAVGERANGTVSLVAGPPGEHLVTLGPLGATLHVRGPSELRLARASSVPGSPAVGETFTLLVYVENAGETSGRARIEVYEGERLVQRTTEAVIEARTTDALTLPMRFDEAGLRALEIRLVSGTASGTLHHEVHVLPAPARDVPGPTPLALLAALAGLVLTRAARERRPR